MTEAGPLRFVLQSIAEGLIFSLLFCVLGVLTLKLASDRRPQENTPAAVPGTLYQPVPFASTPGEGPSPRAVASDP